MAPTLLSLPAEIRLMIWNFALLDLDEPIVVHHPPPFKFCYQRASDPRALYRTCRQIRNELPSIDAKGITLVLHLLPWQDPNSTLSGPTDLSQSKFLRMAPYIERLRISGAKLCKPEDLKHQGATLRKLAKKTRMPRLRSVELQPQGWGCNDWSLAFEFISSLGLGKQDVSFLTRDGRARGAPSDLFMIPEWARLRTKSPERVCPPKALPEITF